MELLEEKIHLWIDSARYVKAKSGVYILYNRKLEPIYIGESDNLQKQFSDYLDTNFQDNECKQKTHSYQRIFTEDQTEKKKILLEQFLEEYGRVPECNSE
jgi:excinuclease UvrABC nuclease subunit